MAFLDRRIASILLTILLFAVVLGILYAARRVLLIFIFATLFAYLLDPVVRFLQRHSLFFKDLRRPAVVEAYLVFLLLIVFAVHAFAPSLVSTKSTLFGTLPVMIQEISTGEITKTIGDKYGWSEAQKLSLKALLVRHQEGIKSLLEEGEQFASNALVILFVAPILAIFLLADGSHIVDAFIRLVSTEENQHVIRGVTDELNDMFRKYIRAKVILGGWSFGFYSVAMLLLRFPHAMALGVLGGILEFIPVAGWMISAATIIVVGLLTHCHWIWMAALLGIWRMVMDYFITPRVVGHNLEIHPLMVIFGVMVGGEIGGIVGIYLSVPLMIIIRVIWQRFMSPAAQTAPELLHADSKAFLVTREAETSPRADD